VSATSPARTGRNGRIVNARLTAEKRRADVVAAVRVIEMIHYHGGPITPQSAAIEIWSGRHAMISHEYPEQLPLISEICQSFALDNGAFSAWKRGCRVDFDGYLGWVMDWRQHPGFDWCLIPDIVDGTEEENTALIHGWMLDKFVSVPIWHLHESLDKLTWLCDKWPRVALGSSGEFATPGARRWWSRISEAMRTACDSNGRPKAKLHGLRMLSNTITSHLPLASADSTNVARNIGIDAAWRGPYQPPNKASRALILARRIESHACASRWSGSCGVQENLELIG